MYVVPLSSVSIWTLRLRLSIPKTDKNQFSFYK